MSLPNTIERCPKCDSECSCDELARNNGKCDICDLADWADEMDYRDQIMAWEEMHGCPAVERASCFILWRLPKALP